MCLREVVMRRQAKIVRFNRSLARAIWGELSPVLVQGLKDLMEKYGVSIALGDVQQIDGCWYVTHAGLLRIAERRRCHAVRTSLQKDVSDPIARRWVFKATVYKASSSRGFVGYGDADPSNVSLLVRGAEMRVAETRAVNRALRKAYGIGLCSIEELGWVAEPRKSADRSRKSNGFHESNGSNGNPPRLRDQLCLLIRQYNLDPTLVKSYAAHFCGTETLKEASRDLVDSFISHLASSAKEDRAGLICKLNSYAQPVEEVKQ
jgi:hypothetical protein